MSAPSKFALPSVLEEIERRDRVRLNIPDIFAKSFQHQKDFILDPAKLKALFCTRRSAKSYTAGLYLVHEALRNPGCNCLFIALTRDSAKRILWKDVLKDIDADFKLGMRPNETSLTMTLPNGSVIYLTGADADEDEKKKLLGGKYRVVCIDEASMYTIDVRDLVYGILKPAVADPNSKGERGSICLMGTASNFPMGLFFDVTTKKEPGWSMHEWTAHDNPYVAKQWQQELDEISRERPLYMETPQFKQWYLNQWVIDEEKLCYRFNPSKNLIDKIPMLNFDGWTRVLGVDLGWEDDNAFVLTAYHVNDPRLYVLKTFHKKKLTFDQVAETINRFQSDSVNAPHKIIIDGANKQGVESMRLRSAIPFEYAEKQDKATFIELCNADLVQGKIAIHNTTFNRPLWEEMASLVWVTEGDKIKLPKKEHPSLPNHLCDAFLYAWRMGYHFHAAPVEKKIIHGSREWYMQKNEDVWAHERERLKEEQEKGLWPEEVSYNIDELFR